MAFTPDGGLLVGSSEGLAHLDAATGEIRVFRHRPDDPASPSGNAIEAIAYDAEGRLFLGTGGGLDLFDPRRGRLRAFRHEPGRKGIGASSSK